MPPPECYQTPHALHDAERPGTLEETVNRAKHAGAGKKESEPSAPRLEGIEHDHRRYGEKSEKSEPIDVHRVRLRCAPVRAIRTASHSVHALLDDDRQHCESRDRIGPPPAEHGIEAHTNQGDD